MSEYVVIYEQSEDGGWGAYMPDLPGVVALGSTRPEVAERIQEALSAYSDDLRERGQTLPAGGDRP
jgi:predicted RNase H-like HicB family nuclease